MDPYGHNHHHITHHRREEPPYPPPPNPYSHHDPPPPLHVGGGPPHHYPPPPPHHHHEEPPYPSPPNPYNHHDLPPPPHVGGGPPHYHRREEPPYPPPPNPYGHHDHPPPLYPSPPPYTADYHHPPPPPPPHHSIPHTLPIINHHHTDHEQKPPKYTDNKPTVRVYTKAKTDYSLTIREGKVILAPSNPLDHHQHWIKDEKFSTRVKDEEGFPAFALVNKATGEAMKHSVGATYPVQLTKYNPNKLDESVLWTQSKDLGDGYRTVRMVNNIRLNVDAFNGDKNHGGVRDGTKIVLWEWKKGDNQRWTMVPF